MLPPLPKLPLCSPHIRVTIKCVISCPFLSPLPVGQETEVSSGSEEPITLCNLRCMCWLLWSTEPFIGPTPANPGFLPLLKCFLFLSLAVLRSRVIFLYQHWVTWKEEHTHTSIHTYFLVRPALRHGWKGSNANSLLWKHGWCVYLLPVIRAADYCTLSADGHCDSDMVSVGGDRHVGLGFSLSFHRAFQGKQVCIVTCAVSQNLTSFKFLVLLGYLFFNHKYFSSLFLFDSRCWYCVASNKQESNV